MKTYTIIIHDRNREPRETSGTIDQLTEYFGYTLLKGQSWEHERGNKRIDCHPKTIASLIKNLNNAENNAAMNGYSGRWYEKKEA
jgi:hypothetical protein